MPLAVEELVLGIDQAKGVAAESVHMAIAVRSSTVREKNRYLVQRFRREGPEIPHHRWGLQIRLWIAFLRVDKIAEF